LTLWPLELAQVQYAADSGAYASSLPAMTRRPKATLRLRFEARGGVMPAALKLDRLPLFLRGSENLPLRLYEQLTGHVVAAMVMPVGRQQKPTLLPARCIVALGFSDDEALLPPSRDTFRGHRLLQEYFAFADRFRFVELRGLRSGLGTCDTTAFDVILFLDEHDALLESTLSAQHFGLFCTPAINLFPRRADRIALNEEQFEYQVIVDHTRPLDFEVYSVESVVGYRTSDRQPQRFEPLYCRRDGDERQGAGAYFQARRQARMHTEHERRYGARSRYLGSEVFIALVDRQEAPYPVDLRQLGVDLLCTNRDLPLSMPIGIGPTDFSVGADLPVQSVRCLAGPSIPRPGLADAAGAWQLINRLSLNYLSIADAGDHAGGAGGCASALRELLGAYCPIDDEGGHRLVAALRDMRTRPVTRRLPLPGPISFGRGLEIDVVFDDTAIERTSAFLLGAVLHAFFASYVCLNHFTETVIHTSSRARIMRWQPEMGLCAIL
jgi:type VI secretion system protein ImpG